MTQRSLPCGELARRESLLQADEPDPRAPDPSLVFHWTSGYGDSLSKSFLESGSEAVLTSAEAYCPDFLKNSEKTPKKLIGKKNR
jgi:hypothetical protein